MKSVKKTSNPGATSKKMPSPRKAPRDTLVEAKEDIKWNKRKKSK